MTTSRLNKARIADLHTTMSGHIERADIPGIVTLIGLGDEIHVDAIGMQTVDGKVPMRRETIFPDCVDYQAGHGGCDDDSGRRRHTSARRFR
jgi:hypothetical protein